MKVYVAAKFNDKEKVKQVYESLKKEGHIITHEWIHNKPASPFTENPEFTAKCVTEDINGVLSSDIFILLSNVEPSLGSATELGVAIASFINFKKPYIYVVGPYFDANFAFFHAAVQQKETIADVLKDMEHCSNL